METDDLLEDENPKHMKHTTYVRICMTNSVTGFSDLMIMASHLTFSGQFD